MSRPNKTSWILLAGFAILLFIILYFSLSDASRQDRLDDVATPPLSDVETNAKDCAGNVVNAALKNALFDQAAQSRPADAAAFREIAASAFLRMENPAIEGEVDDRLDCSASIAIDLPPGIVASSGRSKLMGNVDYSVWRRTGDIAIRSGSGMISALTDLQRASGGISAPLAEEPVEDPLVANNLKGPTPPAGQLPPPPVATPPRQPLPPPIAASPRRPSPPAVVTPPRQPPPRPQASATPPETCARARGKAEQLMCADPRLGAFDREMASRYQRAMSRASPAQRLILRDSEFRFLYNRDRCRDADCIIRVYQGRFTEIADIMSGGR